MLKETNLDGVKSVARMLLMTPVHKTPYSPAVVQHPFASSGLVGITREGILYVLDITDSEENLKQWHEFIKSKIDEAENVWEIYAFINKPYAMTFLKFAEPYLSKEDFSKILGDAWVRSENPNDDPNFTKRDLIAMFKRADKQALMTEEDYKRWKDLEKSITVYRGVTLHNEKNKSAPTYTLKAGGSTISSGSYTNKQVVYTATDANLSYIRYKRPNYSSYSTSYSSTYTIATTATNGWWYFYAVDSKSQSSSTVSVFLDTLLPEGTVTDTSGTIIPNEGYTFSAVKYTATDSGSGVSGYQYKKPGATSWSSYTSGTAVTGTGFN